MITITALVAMHGAYQAGIDQYLQPNFQDAKFTGHIIQKNTAELAKINKDFGANYAFDETTVWLKEPFMLRVQSKIEDTSVLYIINGTSMKASFAGIRRSSDLSKSAGRRQTAFDFGILTPSLFRDFYDAKFVRLDRATGDAVFDVNYKPEYADTTRFRIWVSRTTHVVDKREWYNRYGRMLATFYYLNPEEVSGVWLPTRLEVRNVDNVIAGTTRYDSMKVNSGLSDSWFSTR